ncbi:MAG: ankyrin repeat domain-containing protein [Capsulimonadaceae bacterium]|nr:ankyrin repeat domain-containing protein [Capsulimonadaceae bacterium]
MPDPNAFEIAIKSKDSQAAIRLVRQDAMLLSAPVSGGLSPIQAAAYAGLWDLVRWLAEVGGIASLADAILADDAALLKTLVHAHPEQLNAYTHDGFTPLHLAAFFGRDSVAMDLISFGADVDAVSQNELCNQPLHAAIAGAAGDDVIAALIGRGADVASGDPPPLHIAAANGRGTIVRLLLAKGVDPGARSHDGRTAADLATDAGHIEIAELLR